jgi:NADP-dependent 3-hydroxy acid dehydrogenase YdfG
MNRGHTRSVVRNPQTQSANLRFFLSKNLTRGTPPRIFAQVNRSKIAIVTGATSGIGAAIARVLSASGIGVFLIGRDARRLAGAARRIPRRYLAGTAVANLAAVSDVKQLLAGIARRFRRVDVLVHAAGEYSWTEPGDVGTDAFDALFAVNVRAPYLLTQGTLPLLARAKGQVIFINSSILRSSARGAAAFKATQHAVQGFTDSLRQDLNRHGIRVTSLYPGRTATSRMRRIYAHEGRQYQPGILLSPQAVAQVVLAVTQVSKSAEITDIHLRSVTSY